MDPTRRILLRSIRTSRRQGKAARATLKAVAHSSFPLTFFFRNLASLRGEAGWLEYSPRLQRALLLRLLRQRCAIFLEVKQWKALRGEVSPKLDAAEPKGGDEYCHHCGWCCEICSGFPDFPGESGISPRWRGIFGDGLGKGHRFCAFLWEGPGGRSFCSIHPHRSNPCRIFEREECEFLLKDPGIRDPSMNRRLIEARDWFIHLVDRR